MTILEDLLPARRVTSGAHHFFGYYDKSPRDATGRYLLAMQVDFIDRMPTAADPARIGMLDLHDENRWIPLACTSAWCWQQGAMLQWLPGDSAREIIYNQRDGDRFISIVQDVFSGQTRELPRAIYAINGSQALCLNFARNNRTRPGYGYADTVRYRGLDCQISEKYGIRMCSGDTIGPGGIFRAMRDLPAIMDCAVDIERYCPDAWVINYINPSAVNGLALARYAPGVKSFALCDSLHMPHVKARYAARAGIIADTSQWRDELDADFDLRIAGVNHFTWMLKTEWREKDVSAQIAESLRRSAATEDLGGNKGAKALHNDAIAWQLYDIFGYLPTCVAHTKEYLRFYQGHGRLPDAIPPLSIWETDARYVRHDKMWRQVDDFNSGALPIRAFMQALGPDHATDIIENMVGGLGQLFYINSSNRGAVSNMADDAFLELLCDIDIEGPRPRPVGEMPRGLRRLSELVLDTHELTAEAIVRADYSLLRRALMTDPLTNSVADADAILGDLLAAQRDALPDHWYAETVL